MAFAERIGLGPKLAAALPYAIAAWFSGYLFLKRLGLLTKVCSPPTREPHELAERLGQELVPKWCLEPR